MNQPWLQNFDPLGNRWLSTLAAAIPSGPASLGTFELAAVRIASALGVATPQAFALALLVHATILEM